MAGIKFKVPKNMTQQMVADIFANYRQAGFAHTHSRIEPVTSIARPMKWQLDGTNDYYVDFETDEEGVAELRSRYDSDRVKQRLEFMLMLFQLDYGHVKEPV